MAPSTRGALAGLLSALLFGAGVPVTKRLLPEVPPVLLAALLYSGGGLAVGAARQLLGARVREAPLGRADVPRLLAVALLGGALGPLCLVHGLRAVSGVTGSLLLNLEGPFTVLLALWLFHEHLGRAGVVAVGLVFAGAALLAVDAASAGGAGGADAGAGLAAGAFAASRPWGVVLLVLACLAWALDNNLTQGLASKDPWQLVAVKTLGSGVVLAVLGLALGERLPRPAVALAALALGSLSYGASVLLDAYALRLLGAAREAAFFATAPFAGALLSLPLLGDRVGGLELPAALLMLGGVVLLVRERHGHEHTHAPLEHAHVHVHDAHHRHEHPPDVDPRGPHAHPHRHAPLTHAHAHVSDAHHRHRH